MDDTEAILPDIMPTSTLRLKNILPAPLFDPSVYGTRENSSVPARALVTYSRLDKEKSNQHKCEHCGKEFEKRWQLVVHAKVHPQEKTRDGIITKISFKKTVCDTSTPVLGIHRGMPEHRCVCGKVFCSKWLLSQHMHQHTGKKTNLYECDICKKCFRSSSYLSVHKRSHEGGKPFTCEICSNSYARHDSVVRHKKLHHSGTKKVPKSKTQVCELCNGTFYTANLLIQHITAVHAGERLYKCDECGKSYSEKKRLTQHQRVSHSGKKNFVLPVPPVVSPTTPVKKSSQKKVVNKTCEFCNKTFCTTKLLKEHRNIHTGERMFECNYCDRRFNFRSNLNLHKKRWHRAEKQADDQTVAEMSHIKEEEEDDEVKDKEKVYTCNACSREFKCLQTLKKHAESCNGTTNGQPPGNSLKQVKKELHACELCGKSFTMRNSLVRHRRTHTGEKPYVCDICGRSFALKYNADKHRRNHAKDETDT